MIGFGRSAKKESTVCISNRIIGFKTKLQRFFRLKLGYTMWMFRIRVLGRNTSRFSARIDLKEKNWIKTPNLLSKKPLFISNIGKDYYMHALISQQFGFPIF